MDQTDLSKIADAWIAFNEIGIDSPESSDLWWAIQKVMEWNIDRPELVWEFILLANNMRLSDKVTQNLAAGPLEDLLVAHGSQFIERIVKLAQQDESFSNLLGGVWQNAISPEIWNQLIAVRKQRW